MGFLDRVIGVVNRVGTPVQDAMVPVDPRLGRGEALAAEGVAGTGRIVGIHRKLDGDSTTATVFAIDVAGSPSEAPSRVATEVTTTPHLHRLRLGLDVPVRTEAGGRGVGVIDWAAFATASGLDGSEPGQRRHRKPPGDGIVDTALDARVQKRLSRGRRTTATVTSLERVFVLGMATVNWDVHLRLDDGSTTVSRKDQVPPYAWWFAAPGREVPVAVDERDPAKASVDWPAVAMAAASAGVARVEDPPPAGSIAAEFEAARAAGGGAAEVASMGAADPTEVIAANRNAGHVNATLQSWVGEVHAGRMKPKAFLRNVAEWEAAGLCTPEEATTARASAGVA